MRKLYFLVLGLLIFSGVNAQIVNIPDVNFKKRLLQSTNSNDGNGNGIAKIANGALIKIDANSNGELEQEELLKVYSLDISRVGSGIQISSLTGIEYFKNLEYLYCGSNLLTTIDISKNKALIHLSCDSNRLINLDLSNNPLLTELTCSNNPMTHILGLNKSLRYIDCHSCPSLTDLDLSGSLNFTSIIGWSSGLKNLNLSGCVSLQKVQCQDSKLLSLDLSGDYALSSLSCGNNQLTSLNLNDNTALNALFCNNNKIINLNIDNNTALKTLYCNNNQLTSLNLDNNTLLNSLTCDNNQLTSLNVGNNTALKTLICNNNKLTSLNVDNNTVLYDLKCNNNLLTILNIKNGLEGNLNFSNNPNLTYICADDFQISRIQSYILQYGYINCQVNSYCTFVPGGIYFTIEGNTKLDSNTNGCDELDLNYPNLKFTITDGINIGNLISNATGNYTIPVQAGTQTITPILENLPYFKVLPASTVVTFPTQTSPFTQDFCVTANGTHPDLEIAVLPTTRLRPGFDASYKILYKNKGTNMQSGLVNLTFKDAVLDLVTANPVFTNQNTNIISWNFTNLKPFETREIEVTLNVNSPMETPSVNNNDILSYTATITSAQIDETPVDNTFVLNQTVVGSFDPNDKTCLEGATIPPSAVGKYVHYLIRFENKGTAEAQNVVVKDMIDTSKFDISSLVVTQGSHPFVTKISEINKVEFIFENINLPFDDATNDGYVAFKIKTKPSLVVGDSFSNTASIYFDYNFPIVTNTATTSVLQSLGNNDFEFDSYFSVYPNPVQNSLNVDIKKQIKVSSISIYNTLGQQILVIPNAQYTKQVDVSNLKTGNYFIKLTSDKGSSVGKFIKS